MEYVTPALLALIAAAVITRVVQAHRTAQRQRPIERLAVAEERRRTARALEHLEHDLGWLDALTVREDQLEPEAQMPAGQPRRLSTLELQASPVESDVETRREGNDQVYVVRGPLANPTITDLGRGVHLEFVGLELPNSAWELVVNPHARTATSQLVDPDGAPAIVRAGSPVNVFGNIKVATAVWSDPDDAQERYAARLTARNADAGVTLERNGAGDVTIATEPAPIPEGKSVIVELDDEGGEVVGLVDTAELERRHEAAGRWEPILPNEAELQLEPVADPSDPPLEEEHHPGAQGHIPADLAPIDWSDPANATLTRTEANGGLAAIEDALPGTCTAECLNPCVTHADPEAVNGRHPDGTRRCRTESCNGSPEPRKAWCAACLAETPENPVQDACDALAGQLQAAKETADLTDDAGEPEPPAEEPEEKPRCRLAPITDVELPKAPAKQPPATTGLGGPRLAAPLPTQPSIAAPAPRTIPAECPPIPDGWVQVKDAAEIIGCSAPAAITPKLRNGDFTGTKHPAKNRHGFVWIMPREEVDAIAAEYAAGNGLRRPPAN